MLTTEKLQWDTR